MAISIHNSSEMKMFTSAGIKKKNNTAGYKRGSQNNTGGESSGSRGESEKTEFTQGMKVFVDTLLPGKNVLTELTGIAEMDAVGLQFFIAVQRQLVQMRLSSGRQK